MFKRGEIIICIARDLSLDCDIKRGDTYVVIEDQRPDDEFVTIVDGGHHIEEWRASLFAAQTALESAHSSANVQTGEAEPTIAFSSRSFLDGPGTPLVDTFYMSDGSVQWRRV